MSVISMKQLLEAGVHFGHQTRRWNPKMAPYIYTERNGIYIIDLQQSVGMVDDAYNAIADIVADGGSILFVGTKKQAQDAIKTEAERCGMYYVNERWLGGMLTNFKTIQSRIERLKEIEAMEETPDLEFPGAEDSQVEYLLEEDEIDPETTEPEDRKQDIRPIPRYSFLTGPEYHHRYRVIYSHPYQLIFEVLMTDPTETLPDLPVSFYRKLSDSPSLWMCLIYPVALDFPAQELENEFDQVIDWYNSL